MKKQLLTAIAVIGLFAVAQNAQAYNVKPPLGTTFYNLEAQEGMYLTSEAQYVDVLFKDRAPECEGATCKLVANTDGQYFTTKIGTTVTPADNLVGYVRESKETNGSLGGTKALGVFKK